MLFDLFLKSYSGPNSMKWRLSSAQKAASKVAEKSSKRLRANTKNHEISNRLLKIDKKVDDKAKLLD